MTDIFFIKDFVLKKKSFGGSIGMVETLKLYNLCNSTFFLKKLKTYTDFFLKKLPVSNLINSVVKGMEIKGF